ncbi:hypothetical protein [Neomoorella thermoacetica]|nr:hypothetical protein [Moorella thermoacetica]OIQ59611.1 hypothetical protein MTIN_21850 [Moorella thermoacetica]
MRKLIGSGLIVLMLIMLVPSLAFATSKKEPLLKDFNAPNEVKSTIITPQHIVPWAALSQCTVPRSGVVSGYSQTIAGSPIEEISVQGVFDRIQYGTYQIVTLDSNFDKQYNSVMAYCQYLEKPFYQDWQYRIRATHTVSHDGQFDTRYTTDYYN